MTPKPTFNGRLASWISRWFRGRRDRNRRGWDERWSREDFDKPWLSRGVSKEVIAAVQDGWFPRTGRAIDLGCGEGEIAAWLAEQGYEAMGVDIAPAAIDRARARFGSITGRLAFAAHDLCVSSPPGGPYQILVDRGCYHQISERDLELYGRNLREATTSDARLLLLHKAFRNGTQPGDRQEHQRVTDRVNQGLGGSFVIEKSAETYLDGHDGKQPDSALPGLVFWLKRVPGSRSEPETT